MNIEVLFEDDLFYIVDKPSGVLTHPTNMDRESPDLVSLYKNKEKKKIYPLQRLDKATSGIVIFLKDNEARKQITKNANYLISKKIYTALIRGHLKRCNIFRSLAEDKNKPDLASLSHIYPQKSFRSKLSNQRHDNIEISHIVIELSTGRQHQIRKHLSSLHRPILGDTTFGDNKLNQSLKKEMAHESRLMLHCKSLCLFHPRDKKEISITSRADPMQEMILRLGSFT